MYSDNLTQKVAQAAAKIMDEELKGKQHKIDANKNGKVDAHDFKLLRAKKEVKEESEQIDELSKATLRSYLKGNRDENQGSLGSAGHMSDKARSLGRTNDDKDIGRAEGDELARRKLGAPGLVPAKVMAQNQAKKLTKEEQEFIDELAEGTYKHEVEKSFPASGVKTGDSASKGTSTMPKDKDKAKGQPAGSIGEGYFKNIDTNRKEDERLAKKDSSPFGKPDKKKTKIATPGKFGYGYSAARHLARQGMAGVTKEETEQIAEDVTVKKDYDDNEQSEHGVYKGKKQIGYVVHNKKENTHTAYHGPQGRDDFGHIDDFPDHNKAVSQIKKSAGIKEDVTKTSSGYIHHARPGVYGGSEKEKHVVDTLRGPKKSELNAIEKEKKMKKTFSEMIELYNEIGLKSLSNMISEEPDNEQFTQELKDQEAKAAGKGKKAEVAKGAVQSVKVEEDVEQIDEISKDTLRSYVGKAEDDLLKKHKAVSNTPGSSPSLKYARQMDMYKRRDNITKAQKKLTKEEQEQFDERQLTEPEMEKKEEIVKSMKKGLSGFKDRYGKDAKSVMYATATKQAKGD